MAYKQVKAFNKSKGGKVAGSCLQNTRLGFGIAVKYPNAWQAWLNTVQHTEAVPTGVDVPIFFSYKGVNNGHIGVRLASGQFWSDGNLYDSIKAYEDVKVPIYVGWGETLNGVRVLECVADKPQATTASATLSKPGKRLYFDPIGQTATFYPVKGGTFAMKIKDASYNWAVLENQGHRVKVNSASAGGDCWVYLIYQTGAKKGQVIPGRSVK